MTRDERFADLQRLLKFCRENIDEVRAELPSNSDVGRRLRNCSETLRHIKFHKDLLLPKKEDTAT